MISDVALSPILSPIPADVSTGCLVKMDIAVSANLKPRPQIRRVQGRLAPLTVRFSYGQKKVRVLGSLSFPAGVAASRATTFGTPSSNTAPPTPSSGSASSGPFPSYFTASCPSASGFPATAPPSSASDATSQNTVSAGALPENYYSLDEPVSALPRQSSAPPSRKTKRSQIAALHNTTHNFEHNSTRSDGKGGTIASNPAVTNKTKRGKKALSNQLLWPSLVNIAAELLPYQRYLAGGKKNEAYTLKSQLRQWLLVLEAKNIPFVSHRAGGQLTLYVPALFSAMAVAEINEFSLEGVKQASFLPSRPWWLGAICLALCLLVWHLLRFGALAWVSLPSPPFPKEPGQWIVAFGLDVHRTMVRGEWWRLVTALTLHSDLRHLLSNILMGGAFFALLAGRVGFRFSLFLIIVGGVLGNGVSLFFKGPAVVSVGFSTSCFALLGIVGAYVFCDTTQVRLRHKDVVLLHAPRWFTPLAAGLALLAFLGGAGQPNTDFAAHASGAGMGFVLGGLAWYGEQQVIGKPVLADILATLLLLIGCGLVILAWWLALLALNY